jgi:uncharacterized OB-fold protein
MSAAPPSIRSKPALGLDAPAARGLFQLQVCDECAAVQYPPREACVRCLSVQLTWRPQDGRGELIAETQVRHSLDPFFRDKLPWRVGLVQLDAGPVVVAHVHSALPHASVRVRLTAAVDAAGHAALFAFPQEDTSDMRHDRQLREIEGAGE